MVGSTPVGQDQKAEDALSTGLLKLDRWSYGKTGKMLPGWMNLDICSAMPMAGSEFGKINTNQPNLPCVMV